MSEKKSSFRKKGIAAGLTIALAAGMFPHIEKTLPVQAKNEMRACNLATANMWETLCGSGQEIYWMDAAGEVRPMQVVAGTAGGSGNTDTPEDTAAPGTAGESGNAGTPEDTAAPENQGGEGNTAPPGNTDGSESSAMPGTEGGLESTAAPGGAEPLENANAPETTGEPERTATPENTEISSSVKTSDNIGALSEVSGETVPVSALSEVLFVASEETAEQPFSKVEENYEAKTWMVTCQGSGEELAVMADDGKELSLTQAAQGDVITLTHLAASEVFSEATQVSALLVDEEEQVCCYGCVNTDVSAVETELVFADGLSAGEYELYLFAEEKGKISTAAALGEPVVLYVKEDALRTQLTEEEAGLEGLSAADALPTYSVDVEWGAMTFVYRNAGWDTTSLTSSGEGAWKVYDGANACCVDGEQTPINRLSITNHSTGEIYASLQYDNSANANVQGKFYASEETKDCFVGEENGIPAYLWLEAPTGEKESAGSVFFMPQENPIGLSGEATQIGTIRVRIQTDKPQ